MSCPVCGDRGILRVRYHDGAPDAYGLCLCETGQRWRRAENAGRPVSPTWFIWAAAQGVSHDQVFPIEDLLDESELALIERGNPASTGRSIADAMRTKRPKL